MKKSIHISEDKKEENKFKNTIQDMIYKLFEDEDVINSTDSIDNQSELDLTKQNQINFSQNANDNVFNNNINDNNINSGLFYGIPSLNNIYLDYNINNNNISQPFNNNIFIPNIKKSRNTFPENKIINFKRGKNRKKTYDTPIAFPNNKIEIEILINKIKLILEKTGKIDYHVYNLIKGRVLSIIKNHKGSKIFQKYIKQNNTSDEIIHLLFIELSKNLYEFMTNPYSNYFFKKFFVCLSLDDRIYLLKKIEKQMVQLSIDEIGTYPIQTMIEFSNNKIEKIIILSALKNHIEKLIYNPYGSYVVEKLISCMPENDITFIFIYLLNNFSLLAFNSNSICVIKKLLTLNLSKEIHEIIKKNVIQNYNKYILHPCGNFVIQTIVEHWKDYLDIINLYINNFFNLSLEKYASNVIERFIEKDEKILEIYIEQIIKTNKIYEVMKSKFGNYVIQKAIKLSKNEYKIKLIYNAAIMIESIKDNKIIAKWKSILMPHIIELPRDLINRLNQRNFFCD